MKKCWWFKTPSGSSAPDIYMLMISLQSKCVEASELLLFHLGYIIFGVSNFQNKFGNSMQKNIWWQFVFFVIGHDFHSHTYENLLFFISSHPVAKGAWPQNYQMFASLPTLGPWRQWCSTKLWSLSKGRPLPRATGVHSGIFMWPSSENRTLGFLLIIVLGQRYTIKCSAERKYDRCWFWGQTEWTTVSEPGCIINNVLTSL